SGDVIGLQNRSRQSRSAVVERRHAIEKMRRLARAGGNRGQRFVVRRVRMTERDAMASRGEPADQIEPAVELWRDGDNADVGRGALELAEDVGGGEVAARRGCLSAPRAAFERRSWRAQARGRLRPAKRPVDEIAFEVRRQ